MSTDYGSLKALLGNREVFSLRIAGVPALTRVIRFSGHESISALFEFHCEIAGPETKLAEVVGKSACLTIDGLDTPKYIHGEIASFEYTGHTPRYALYELTLVPGIWRLLHRHTSRIFQHKTTPQVIEAVLKDAGLAKDAFRFDLDATYEPRNYCVQYRESDLGFIARLMEEDGIFYFYEHDDNRATLVVADHTGAHVAIPGSSEIWFNAGGDLHNREHITHVRVQENMRPGRVTLRDFNLHEPDRDMEIDAQADRNVDLEVYDYPAEYQDPGDGGPHQGKSIAKIRLEALQVGRRHVTGASDCMRLGAGHTYSLVGHPWSDFDGEFLLTRVVHHGSQPQVLDEDAQGAFHYGNDFTCIERSTPYRSRRVTPRPVVRGVQTATVVGPGSEEVHTDEHGRVLVQFHWDRQGQHDENSSCWVRVSQLWAGSGWGTMFIPRVGHEVLVDFIEGDPDRPIITGRVYHGRNSFPYALPDEKTKTTVKSDSSPGGGGFNELRFEDAKGSEEMFLHAQKDLNEVVLNDNSRSVTADQSFSIGGNQSFTITGNRSVTVTEGDESLSVVQGKSTATIKQNREVTVESGDNSVTVTTGKRTVTVNKAITETSTTANIDLTAKTSMSLMAQSSTLSVIGNKSVSVWSQTAGLSLGAPKSASLASTEDTLLLSGNKAVTLQSQTSTLDLLSSDSCTMCAGTTLEISAPTSVGVHGGTQLTLDADAITINATAEINLAVGNSVISIKPDGITISGPKITSTAIGLHEISGALIKIN